jgi:hypothetical protein
MSFTKKSFHLVVFRHIINNLANKPKILGNPHKLFLTSIIILYNIL